jgi:Na+/H+-dicarboxylate symporter
MSFSMKIVVGLLLGVALGLFLGEPAGHLGPWGEAFIGLLQMTVLPYIVISLVTNIGRLSLTRGRRLVRIMAVTLVGLLAVGLLLVVVSPLALPLWETGSFFSTSLVEVPEAINFLEIYIPSNPFASLANNVVPAVVLFSILLGVGLMAVEGKDRLLAPMDALGEGLNRVNKLVIKLTPAGIFCIAASTAGSLTWAEVTRLQAYLVLYTAFGALLLFLVLPAIISAFTPFRYREIFSVSKDTLITIFATGKIIVVLPQLVESVTDLYARHDLLDEERTSAAEIIMPLAYPFPNLGTLTIMMFVPFAAWYAGIQVDIPGKVAFLGALLPSSFVSPVLGIPFLLDLLRIPQDMFELFVISTVYTDRVRVAVGGMHLLALTVIAVGYLSGIARLDTARALRGGAASLLVLAAIIGATRGVVATAMDDVARSQPGLVDLHFMEPTRPAVDHRDDRPPPLPAFPGSRLDAVRARGFLRVAYKRDALPFAFVNADGESVGLEIELMHRLTRDLGVDLELVRIGSDEIVPVLESGVADIVVGGIVITPAMSRAVRFAGPYMHETAAFLVPDDRRTEFSSEASVRRMTDLTLGVATAGPDVSPLFTDRLPNATLVHIPSPRAFLRGERPDIDALLFGAESGAAWTMVYPQFAVAVPMPRVSQAGVGLPIAAGAEEWDEFLSNWLDSAVLRGDLEHLFDHWILGGGVEPTEPRWSLIRDVLGWVD